MGDKANRSDPFRPNPHFARKMRAGLACLTFLTRAEKVWTAHEPVRLFFFLNYHKAFNVQQIRKT